MEVNFIILGRLGNAIYRYMASVVVCIKYNANYVVNNFQNNNLTDNDFFNIFIENKNMQIGSINMCGFYQHDNIYKFHKSVIFDFIKKNPTHYILTDGIKAGDNNSQKYFMMDILNTPNNFNKIHKYVLHLRLEDFVTNNLLIKKERIINLLKTINFENNSICIVCNKIESSFETEYVKYVCDFLKNENINFLIESNDVLTDFYIMKEAEILICSKSTLSWCSAFFSNKIKLCYFPDYIIDQFDTITCKSPIDNTILY